MVYSQCSVVDNTSCNVQVLADCVFYFLFVSRILTSIPLLSLSSDTALCTNWSTTTTILHWRSETVGRMALIRLQSMCWCARLGVLVREWKRKITLKRLSIHNFWLVRLHGIFSNRLSQRGVSLNKQRLSQNRWTCANSTENFAFHFRTLGDCLRLLAIYYYDLLTS